MEQVITDPNVVAKLAAQVEAAQPTKAKEINTQRPSSNIVELPSGIITATGLVTTVEIRELTGADEEALAKLGDSGRALMSILSRGLVKIGDAPPTQDLLDSMLSGDRDTVLLAIYIATFGPVAYYETFCQSCNTVYVAKIDLNSDVDSVKLADPINDRVFSVELKDGSVATVALPNGVTQRRLLENPNRTMAENLTTVISGCLLSINGIPAMGESTALSLGMADRSAIINELYDRAPGPRLGEVKKACEACGTENPAPLSLAALFRV